MNWIEWCETHMKVVLEMMTTRPRHGRMICMKGSRRGNGVGMTLRIHNT